MIQGGASLIIQGNPSSKLISSGDCFGEIGCLFECPRTYTVQSINYTILSLLTIKQLRMIFSDYPAFQTQMLKQVYSYADPDKHFFYDAFSRIPFLNNLGPALFHKVMYSFREILLEKDEVLFRPGD